MRDLNMQVLFCHDGPLRIDENGNYYGIAHNDQMFKRYYVIANKIVVVIRIKKVSNEAIDRLSKITVSPFKVIEMPNILSAKGIFKWQKARRIIKEAVLSSDYIVARLPSMSGFMAIDYATRFNKPFLTEVVACPWDGFWNHSFQGKMVAPFMYFATKKRVKASKYVVYVTNEFLQRRYPTKGKSVSCSNVALTDFDETVLENRLEKIKNSFSRGKRKIIGTIAAVDVRYKGQQYVIEALGRLKAKGNTNFEYQLVGPGDQSYLKAVAKKFDVLDQVKFLGSFPHEEVFDWLDTVDLYVQPSRQEGLPRALIEAMSRGLPAFGARTGGIPELLEDKYIFSNTKNNVDEIERILARFDMEEMMSQSKRNYKEARKYDKSVIDKRRQDFFKEFKWSTNL